MPVKPVSRKELIEQVLDREMHRLDREIAARALVRGFPAVLPTFDSLVELVCPMRNPTLDVFNILSDAYRDVHPLIEGDAVR